MTQRTLQELLQIYNKATNPAVLRSDHEHKRNNQLAKAAKNILNKQGYREGIDYFESNYTGKFHLEYPWRLRIESR